MQNNYSLLVQNLVNLSQASSSRDQKAEEWLQQQTRNNPQIHILMRQAILDTSLPYNARMLCSTSLNNHLINSLQENPLNEVFTFARQIIRDPGFPEEHFRNLQRFFIELINRSEENCTQEWLMLFKELLQQKLNGRAFFVLAAFAVADKVKDTDFIYFINLAISWSVQGIMNMINVNGSIHILEWSKAMCQVITKLYSKKDQIFTENLQIITSNGEICKIILMVYQLQTSLEYGYLTVSAGLTQLNILKGSFCELHSLLLQNFRILHKKLVDTPNYSLIVETVSRLSTSLLLVAKDYDKYNEELQCSDFIRNITKVFSHALITCQCNQIFLVFAGKLINEAIFPALIFNEMEVTSFQENNQEFVHHVEDIFQKHQSNILKSDCADLLQSMGDVIDGTTTYAITTAINSLKANLKIIEKIQGTLILTNSQSVLVLGIFNCCYFDRPDIAEIVGTFLSQNSEVILKTFSPLELAILYIFMGYVEDVIFPQNDDGFIYLKHSSICRVHPTTQYAALTFLSNHISRVPSLEILKILLERTQNCGYGLIWTILQDFIKSNINVVTEEVAIDLVNVILNQINKQFQNFQSSSYHTIMQCLNNIREVINPKIGFLKGKPTLQATIWKTFELLKIQGNRNADDVIYLLNDFVKVKATIDKQIFDLFPLIDARVIQDQNLYIDIFPFINIIILKGDYKSQTSELLKILQWCLKPLGIQSFKEYQRAESLLLLQLFLNKYISILSPVVVIQTLSLLGQYRTKLQQPPAMLRLLTTILCFYNSPINIPKLELIKPILSLDYSLPPYFQEYTKKMIVLFLTNVFFVETQLQILILVMNGIINLLNNWKSRPEPRSNKKNKKIAYNKQKYLQSITKLKSEYKKMDIFAYFSDILNKMKLANPTVSTQIINGLSQQNKNNLKNILGMRQVAKETQVRKIVKIKGVRENVEFEKNQMKIQNANVEQLKFQKKNFSQEKFTQEQGMQQIIEQQENVKARVTKKRELKTKNKKDKRLTTVK